MRSIAIAAGLSLLATLAACSSSSSSPGPSKDAGDSTDSASPGDDSSVAPPAEGGQDDSGAACGTLPTDGVYATFTDGADAFHVSITNRATIDAAIALWKGTATASI